MKDVMRSCLEYNIGETYSSRARYINLRENTRGNGMNPSLLLVAME